MPESPLTAPTNSEPAAPTAPAAPAPAPEAPAAAAPTEPAAPAPEAPKAPEAPETYTFTAPEGQTLDSDFVKAYEAVSREQGLTQGKAQAILDRMSPQIEKQQLARIESLRKDWESASKADPEFGGEKFVQNIGVAKTALSKFGTPALTELLDASGLGNHPEVIRFFHRVGKAVAEDTFVGGGSKAGGTSAPTSFGEAADKLYGPKS